MPLKIRLFYSVVTCAILALLSCTGQENPFKTQDANVNLVVENSLNQLSKDSVSDTVENLVRVGLSAYLPTFITQVSVTIARGTVDTDKAITFNNTASWTDTQWILINLHTIGKHTVTVVTTLQGSAQKTSTSSIEIIGKKIPLAANPLSNSVTEGQSDTFFVSVTGTGSVFTYQWIQNGIILSGANKDSLIVNPVYLADSGSYSCVIKDQWGDSVVSLPAFLHVKANPAVNHKPVLSISGARSIVSGQACALSLSETDADSGQTHTYTMLKSPAGATLTGTSFTWSSPATFEGIDTVVFTVTDNGNPPMSDTQNVYITVGSQSVKTPPVIMVPAADTAPSVAQGQAISFTVSAVTSAGDTATLSAALLTGANLPDSAAFDAKSGQFTWTPTYGESGVYYIIFTATDANGVGKDTVKITVTKTDRPPTVQAQSVNTSISQAITVSLSATDPDNDSIKQWQVTQKPHNGTATLADSTKGGIVYTPNSGFTGADTFAVKASDGTLWSAAATVIVSVSSVEVAPKIATQPRSDTTVAVGGSVTFTVATNNASPSPTFIWYHGTKGSAAMVDSSTNPLYQNSKVAATDSGNYFVVAVNSSGSDTSAYGHLKVMMPPSAPTLSSPANNATGLAVGQTLTWNAVTGATAYRVQVSTASDFSTGIVVDDSTLTAASKALTSLSNGTQYYWRVNAKNAGGASAWSTAFSFTTIVAASGVPVLSSPANGATGVATSQTLAWGTVTGAVTYRVQVSTASDFSAGMVVDDSTLTAASKALSGLTNSTVYYWRVNAKNAGGTSAWSTPSSFTTIVAVPGVPVLSAPANNATGVAVSQTVSWAVVTGALTYRVQVSTASDFSAGVIVDDSTLTTASKALSSLANNTQYYWRVNAKNAGGTSAWSTPFSFTTIVATSGVPVPSAPTNSAVGVALNPTLTWSAVTGAVTYRVQVSTASDFSAGMVVDDSTLTAASKALSGLTNSTVYYWRVNAKNAGGTSAWSAVSSFTTVVATSGVPVLTVPANNATAVPVSTTLTWNAVAGAATYRVQVSTASDFSTGIVVDDSTLTTPSRAVGLLSNSTKYYWHVDAKNAGGTSNWSTAFSFTTIIATPAAPTPTAPANNATGVPVSTTLTWNAVAGAATYRVQVSTASDFSTGIVVDDSTLTSGSRALTSLANSTQYYWHVIAKNAGGVSAWSTAFSFTTIIAAPAAPTLSAPANNATSVSVSPTLVWNAPSDATYYQVEVSTVSNFASTVFNMSGLTATSQAVSTTLSNNTLYYWHANASNPGGTSAWSGTWSFTTVPAAPGAPTLSSPANASTRVAVTPTLNWNAATGASSYDVQVATDPAFSTVVSNGTGITATSTPVSPALSNSTIYYWHVRAVNAGGPSSWSGAWSFTTIGTVSWNPVYNFQSAGTYPMTVAAQGDTILVGTHKQGVYRSPDNGSNWVQDPSFMTVGMNYLTGLAIFGGISLVGNNYGNGKLFYSSNYGTSWSSTTVGGSVLGFAYYGSANRYFAATSSSVMYSTDNGASWNVDAGSPPPANAVLVSGSTLYAGTSSGVQSRAVLGYSWGSAGTGITTSVNAFVMYAGTIYAGAGDGVYKYNGTDTWTKVSSGLPTGSVTALAANGTQLFTSISGSGIYLSMDGGASWLAVNAGLPSGSGWYAVALAINSTTIYAVNSSDYNVYTSPLP